MEIYILFILGFLLLINGANLLIDGASSFAKKFGISDLIIGLTVVALGTTAPELFVNVAASIGGRTELALGNALGSGITNTLLILGIASIIAPLKFHDSVKKEIGITAGVLFLLYVVANYTGNGRELVISKIEGLALLVCFGLFLYYLLSRERSRKGNGNSREFKTLGQAVSSLVGGLIGLIVGGKWIVDGAVHISSLAGVSESIIGLSLVALGTSLPELATAIVAARRGKGDIAIGDILGANILNLTWVLGVSAVIRPIAYYTKHNLNIVMFLIATLALTLSVLIGKKRNTLPTLDYKEGILLLVLYVIYIIIIFME